MKLFFIHGVVWYLIVIVIRQVCVEIHEYKIRHRQYKQSPK
jgi:hypothetical protein